MSIQARRYEDSDISSDRMSSIHTTISRPRYRDSTNAERSTRTNILLALYVSLLLETTGRDTSFELGLTILFSTDPRAFARSFRSYDFVILRMLSGYRELISASLPSKLLVLENPRSTIFSSREVVNILIGQPLSIRSTPLQ